MKKHHYLFITLLLLLAGASSVFAGVSVTATLGTTTGTYTTVKDAFDAINNGTHKGDIVLTVSGTVTETATAVLNASGTGSCSYSTVLITPNGNATISASLFNHMISLNGADNVTINGLNDGTNSLTISNTGTTNAPSEVPPPQSSIMSAIQPALMARQPGDVPTVWNSAPEAAAPALPAPAAPPAAGKVRVQHPNGTFGFIPAEQVDDALKQGFKLAQ